MDNDRKKQINWSIILLALAAIAYYFYPQGKDLTPDDLSTKIVTLSLNMENIHNTRLNESYHRLWTNETKSAFTIGSPGEVLTPEGALDSLKKGDTLTVKYNSTDDNQLGNGVNEVPIYYLQKEKRVYFGLNAYNKVKNAATTRIKVIALIGGILMLLYGFNVISQKIAWIAGGAGVVLFIIVRALDVF